MFAFWISTTGGTSNSYFIVEEYPICMVFLN